MNDDARPDTALGNAIEELVLYWIIVGEPDLAERSEIMAALDAESGSHRYEPEAWQYLLDEALKRVDRSAGYMGKHIESITAWGESPTRAG